VALLLLAPLLAGAVGLLVMFAWVGNPTPVTRQQGSGTEPVDSAKEPLQALAPGPAKPDGRAAPKEDGLPLIPAPDLKQLRTEVLLGEPFAQVRTGGAGRYLIFYLKKARKLAVFDAAQAQVVKELDLPAEDVLFAAGLEKLLVVLPGQKLLQRYDLKTFEREKMVPLAGEKPVVTAQMGCASRGPLLLWTGTTMTFWDIERLEKKDVKGKLFQSDGSYGLAIRVSADGRTFVGWTAGLTGQQYDRLRLDGETATVALSPDGHSFNGHWAQPSADGNLIFRHGGGLYTGEMKPIAADWLKGSALLPCEDPRFFLAVRRGTGDHDELLICTSTDQRPVFTLQDLDRMTASMPYTRWGYVEGEPRVHYLPSASILLSLPESNDRVVVRAFNLLDALKKSEADYLFVASLPRTRVRAGTQYAYNLDVQSSAPGVNYTLENGPEGMAVSHTGELRWDVPAEAAGPVRVVVSVRNRAGKEVFHTFDLTVEPAPPRRGAP
jgi:hypothetical protein